jgi:BolA family transcriptional regulator, general stress-responsive regulator
MNLDQEIIQRLSSLEPSLLEIQDESHLHQGHVGNRGGGHFRIKIQSKSFEGKGLLVRHRMVYNLLADLIPTHIHALSIDAIVNSD